jgi:hypothetical protein
MVTRTLFAFLAVVGLTAASAWSQPAPPAPPGVNPTHYWTYQILDPIPQPAPIFVQDQFHQTPLPLTVERREKLLNWVYKNQSPVPDTLLHYTWWNILEQPPVFKDAIVTNQFGQYVVRINQVAFLLAPAYKNFQSPVPPHGNHYLCYRAEGFPGPPSTYHFIDEWREDQQRPLELQFLCNPCIKHHEGQIFTPPEPLTHLAVYPLPVSSDLFAPFLTDQFQFYPQHVQQTLHEYLFVPSLKQEIPTNTRRDTWSRLKQLYR